jgi:hypothetical protein
MTKLDQLKALGDAKRAARSVSTAKGGASPAAKPALSHTVAHEKIGIIIKRGRGRPKIEGPREWDLAGVSKSTWYRLHGARVK